MHSTLRIAAWVWLLALLPAWLDLAPRPLRFDVLDIGQGDALLIRTPHDRRILIDGGPDGRVLAQLGNALAESNRRIDLLVLTHPHADHYIGLVAVLDQWRVERVALSGAVVDNAAVRELLAALRARQIPISFVSAGMDFTLDGVEASVLAPLRPQVATLSTRPNDDSVVLRLRFAGRSLLLPGDLEAAGERALLASGAEVRADILKAGHHGSASSTSPAFLAAVQPRFFPVSVGLHNLYHHPSPDVLSRASAAGAATARTDQEGALRYVCDAACCRRETIWDRLVFLGDHGCGTLK